MRPLRDDSFAYKQCIGDDSGTSDEAPPPRTGGHDAFWQLNYGNMSHGQATDPCKKKCSTRPQTGLFSVQRAHYMSLADNMVRHRPRPAPILVAWALQCCTMYWE